MGLFDKKYCDICGAKIGLLGNRKLEDGNLCKDCAAKLSPWFTGRRHTNVEAIRYQLQQREENQALVKGFRTSRTFGSGYMKLYLDEAQGNFCVCRDGDLANGNPDILPIRAVTGADYRREEHRTERKYRDKEGKLVSYTPPIYDYSYDFDIVIYVGDVDYIDEIKFQVNRDTLKQGHIFTGDFERSMRQQQDTCNEIVAFFRSRGKTAAEAPAAEAAAAVTAPAPAVPNMPAPQAAPVSEDWECPACTGDNHGGRFCQYCGSPRPQ